MPINFYLYPMRLFHRLISKWQIVDRTNCMKWNFLWYKAVPNGWENEYVKPLVHLVQYCLLIVILCIRLRSVPDIFNWGLILKLPAYKVYALLLSYGPSSKDICQGEAIAPQHSPKFINSLGRMLFLLYEPIFLEFWGACVVQTWQVVVSELQIFSS